MPVIESLQEAGAWKEGARSCQVLIHCAMDHSALEGATGGRLRLRSIGISMLPARRGIPDGSLAACGKGELFSAETSGECAKVELIK